MKSKGFLLIFILTTFSLASVQAQLFIDNSYTVEEMVMDFFDNSCVTPSNIEYTGSLDAVSFFDAGNTEIGTPAGILFSTGNVFDAIGPNDSESTSTGNTTSGDVSLDSLSNGFQTYDASVLEMDIVATGNQLDFSYVFASEEYLEYVGSSFNDIFAFFISGPGISGVENIAMVPNLSDPVAINTINHVTNSQYFIDNMGGQDIEFDGYTTELIASATVIPGESYHIKIAIADVSDAIFDSGIFLGVESLCGDSLLIPPAQNNLSVDGMTITFENQSKYATSFLWDFGDNTTSTEKHPAPHTYAEDGNYEVKLITYNYCCSDTIISNITIGVPTSTDNPELKPYHFSPNPVNDFVNINFENGETFELQIYDASGNLIRQQSANGGIEMGLTNFVSGLYFMVIKSNDKVYHDRFLKL